MMYDLPWLYKLYRNEFTQLASQAWGEPVQPAADDRLSTVLEVQRGSRMRSECHVDPNPVTGILFFTEHPAGGGELIVGQDPNAIGTDALERNCSVIRPRAGQLIFFDGKRFPHYTRTLRSDSDVRVAAALTFYTRSSPEHPLPAELNRHLFGDE